MSETSKPKQKKEKGESISSFQKNFPDLDGELREQVVMWLKAKMLATNMSISEMSVSMGYSQPMLTQILAGNRTTSMRFLQTIVKEYGFKFSVEIAEDGAYVSATIPENPL